MRPTIGKSCLTLLNEVKTWIAHLRRLPSNIWLRSIQSKDEEMCKPLADYCREKNSPHFVRPVIEHDSPPCQHNCQSRERPSPPRRIESAHGSQAPSAVLRIFWSSDQSDPGLPGPIKTCGLSMHSMASRSLQPRESRNTSLGMPGTRIYGQTECGPKQCPSSVPRNFCRARRQHLRISHLPRRQRRSAQLRLCQHFSPHLSMQSKNDGRRKSVHKGYRALAKMVRFPSVRSKR